MKFLTNLIFTLAIAYTANAQDFCKNASHSGESVTYLRNKDDDFNEYSLNFSFEEGWSSTGYARNNSTFYSDGSFSCNFNEITIGACRYGLSFDGTQTHDQIGHIFGDFKFNKADVTNINNSNIGVEIWAGEKRNRFFIVDNWLCPVKPREIYDAIKHGVFEIDGSFYTVYENYGKKYKQYFNVREEPRECGTIDVTAHIQAWERLGFEIGNIHEVKFAGEVENYSGLGVSTVDFPYAKIYVDGSVSEPVEDLCSGRIRSLGYKCCSSTCKIAYSDIDGTWGYENHEWCGCGLPKPRKSTCNLEILFSGYDCCSDDCEVIYTDEDGGHWGYEDGEWCGCGN